jgi:hypothetical protein
MDRSWRGFLLRVLAGILYCIGGLLIIREPVAGSVVITLVLATEAIGHIGEPPGSRSPGRWCNARRPSWGLDEVADAIYTNLVHGRHIAEP